MTTATADEYVVIEVPIEKLFCDDEFNCRGQILPTSVLELATDIKVNGLQFPISIQPREDVVNHKDMPEQFDFRIIAGHRRFHAYKVLQKKTIPCMVKRGYSEQKALLVNLGENLKRLDLNLMQEARAIEKLHQAGIGREAVAASINKSPGWVQVRFYLLEMPVVIQQYAEANIITQNQVKQIRSLKTDEERINAANKIRDAKSRGEKAPLRVSQRKKKTLDTKKARQPDEIVEMSQIIGGILGFGVINRIMAWAAGNITTAELRQDVREARYNSLATMALKFKRGEITPLELDEYIKNDPEIKARAFNFPDEF